MPSSEFGPCRSAAVLVSRKQGSPFFSFFFFFLLLHFPCLWRAAPSQAAANLRGSWASLPSGAPAQPAPSPGAARAFPERCGPPPGSGV